MVPHTFCLPWHLHKIFLFLAAAVRETAAMAGSTGYGCRRSKAGAHPCDFLAPWHPPKNPAVFSGRPGSADSHRPCASAPPPAHPQAAHPRKKRHAHPAVPLQAAPDTPRYPSAKAGTADPLPPHRVPLSHCHLPAYAHCRARRGKILIYRKPAPREIHPAILLRPKVFLSAKAARSLLPARC